MPAESTPESIRLHVNIDSRSTQILDNLMASHEWSKTEATKRAIKLLDYVMQAQARGATILIKEEGRLDREIVILG